MSESKQYIIYTDGACLGNPGPGGYGVIVDGGGSCGEKSGGFRLTTNNRMEITAAIVGLESVPPKCSITLYSDSQYLVKAINEGWAVRWRSKNWMRTSKDKALNPDLWARLLKLCEEREVEFRWVRGHNGHSQNERCDQLANTAAKRGNLPVDKGYEGHAGRLF
jgi:ribonuclease HI